MVVWSNNYVATAEIRQSVKTFIARLITQCTYPEKFLPQEAVYLDNGYLHGLLLQLHI